MPRRFVFLKKVIVCDGPFTIRSDEVYKLVNRENPMQEVFNAIKPYTTLFDGKSLYAFDNWCVKHKFVRKWAILSLTHLLKRNTDVCILLQSDNIIVLTA